MMKKRIDKDQLLAKADELPPSPRDKKIKALGIASFVFYAVAAICAWQLGAWWGIGLVASIFIIDTLNEFVQEEHRQELIDMHSKLVYAIAENSDILDNVVPKDNG